MATHRRPSKLVPVVRMAVLGSMLAIAAACGVTLVSGGGGTPKTATLDGVWESFGQQLNLTVYACLSAGALTSVSANVPECPSDATRVHWPAQSGPVVESGGYLTVYACLASGTLTGMSESAPECPSDATPVHWAAQSGSASSPSAQASPKASAKPSPKPKPSHAPKVAITPSASSSPILPPSPSASASPSRSAPKQSAPPRSAPTVVASPPASAPAQPPAGNQTNCTTNQGGGPNNHVTQLDNNTYHLQANEWNSSATFTICTDGNPDFTISSSGVDVAHNGAPGAYPSVYKGCHWGYCTQNSGMPVAVSTMASTPGKVTTTYDTTTVNNGAWDDSYDIWYNPNSTTNSNNSGLEMMIWLNHFGGTQPAGSAGPTVTLDGISFTVWYGGSGNGGTVSFVANNPMSSVNNLDLGPLAAYAVSKGYMQNSWYLIDVEAGFEPWTSGQGLTADAFNVTVH